MSNRLLSNSVTKFKLFKLRFKVEFRKRYRRWEIRRDHRWDVLYLSKLMVSVHMPVSSSTSGAS